MADAEAAEAAAGAAAASVAEFAGATEAASAVVADVPPAHVRVVAESVGVFLLRNVGPRKCSQDFKSCSGARGAVELTSTSGWELLLGQSECVNWACSVSADVLKVLPDPGEFTVVHGLLQPDEDFLAAAWRELRREFESMGRPELPPEDAVLRPFDLRSSGSEGHIECGLRLHMVALASENPWLQELDVLALNQDLMEQRAHLMKLLQAGERFWSMEQEERLAVSPKVREVCWLPLVEAVHHFFGSLPFSAATLRVDEWQRAEFKRLGISRRDPVPQPILPMARLEALPNSAAVVEDSNRQLGDSAAIAAQRERVRAELLAMTRAELRNVGRVRGFSRALFKQLLALWPEAGRPAAQHDGADGGDGGDGGEEAAAALPTEDDGAVHCPRRDRPPVSWRDDSAGAGANADSGGDVGGGGGGGDFGSSCGGEHPQLPQEEQPQQ